MLIVTADQMREMDRRTIQDVGIPGFALMERAALGAVDVLARHFDVTGPTRIGVLAGGGNNGGDGFAMARLLHEAQHDVWVGALRNPSAYQGDAATNLAILDRLGITVVDLSVLSADDLLAFLDSIDPCRIWVDAIFGIGLDREVEGSHAAAIDFLASQPRVLAVDIPSGIHADTGRILGAAARASVTATFGHAKLGHALYPGRAYAGALHVVDIGIPAVVTDAVGWEAELVAESPWLPPRPATTHKGDAGRIAVIGGEPGKSGSVLMTSSAALRSGAGLVIVGTYEATALQVATAVPEAMATTALARTLEQTHVDELDDLIAWADVIAIGPGLGTHDAGKEVLEMVLDSGRPTVVDADGLTLLAEHRLHLEPSSEILVLTPHPGEAARLCGCSIDEILHDPVGRALEISRDWNAIVVLKGASTVIARDEPRHVAINATGNPGMATAGMGDALTGMIAAQLCERLPAFSAVCGAVWAHGAAGDHAASELGQRGLTVTGLLDHLPAVWRAVEGA